MWAKTAPKPWTRGLAWLQPDRLGGRQPLMTMVLGVAAALGLASLASRLGLSLTIALALSPVLAALLPAMLASYWRRRALRVIERERHLRELAERRASREALSDPLTGLLTLEGIEMRARTLLSSKNGKPLGAGLLVVQLRNMPRGQERRSSTRSDRAVLWAAGLIKSAVRYHDLVARLDAGRFVILVRSASDEVVDRIKERLCHTAGTDFGKPWPMLEMVVGFATAADQETSIETLIERAMEDVERQTRPAIEFKSADFDEPDHVDDGDDYYVAKSLAALSAG